MVSPIVSTPKHKSYDVVIIGGAMIGSSIAWFLANEENFKGSVLVVEKDPTYEFTSTSRTNSCIRQQFSREINIRISQYGAQYIRNFRRFLGGDPRVPEIVLQSFGYMYLAGNDSQAEALKSVQALQAECGAGTKFMTAAEISEAYPFYNMEDIVAGNHNRVDEGYFDGNTMFDWWKRTAREKGVEYLTNEVVAIHTDEGGTKVESVALKSGEIITCGQLVNASGPRADRTARMAGIELPVEPRKRYTYVFSAEKPLDRDLPLTIDPSGIHMRTDGAFYMAGCKPDMDAAVEFDDYEADHSLWEEKVWPVLAHRVPQFEAIKLVNMWVGHYAYNTLDQNAILGAHPQIGNFIFANGFSGHGFQQSPAVGRAISEWISFGEYRSLDMSPFTFGRIEKNEPFLEKAVI